MFRIVDNSDGSTSVFSSDDGKLICTLGSRPGIRPEAVGISRPIVRERSSLDTTTLVASLDRKKQDYFDLTGETVCDNKSNVTSHSEDIPDDASVITLLSSSSSEDQFQDDIIDQPLFLQHLGLISSRQSQNNLHNLKASFPLRNIARVSNNGLPAEMIKDCDEMDICSPLGQMVVKISNSFLNSQAIKLSVKKCEKYCQFSLVSLHPFFSQMPQLRDRDLSKKYPVTFRPLKTWGIERARRYAFNSWQRHENLKILKTGLTKRSRKLKQLCRNLSVVLKKLTKEEIRQWKSRRKSSESCSRDISQTEEISLAKLKSILQNDKLKIVSGFPHLVPTVVLEDVAKKFIFVGDKQFVKGTNILVNNTVYYIQRNLLTSTKKCIKQVFNLPSSDYFSTLKEEISNPEMSFRNLPLSTIKIDQNASYPTHFMKKRSASHQSCPPSAKKIYKYDTNLKSSRQSNFKPVTWTISSRNVESEAVEGVVKPIKLKALHNNPNSNLSSKTVNNVKASLPPLCRNVKRTSSDYNHLSKQKTGQSSFVNHSVHDTAFTPSTAHTLSSVFADHGSYTSSLHGNSPFEPSRLDISKENVTISSAQVAPFSRRSVQSTSCQDHLNAKIDLIDFLPERLPQHSCCSSSSHIDDAIKHWVFLCFGCGLKATYSSMSWAEYNISNHLTDFHSVLQPQSFLKNYYNEKHHLVVVEAFPGYKSNKH